MRAAMLLPLAFDHDRVLATAVARIRGKLDYAPIGFELLPETFTLRDLRLVHEAILGHPLNKDSFRRKVLDRGLVVATGERLEGVGHRPPELYRFARPAAEPAAVTGFDPSALLPLVEPLAVLTGIACVALTVRERISNWPVGILSSALFLVLFLSAGLYADSMLQVVYVVLGFYGWWHWLTGGPHGNDLPVTTASPRLRAGARPGRRRRHARVRRLPRWRDGLDGPLPRCRDDRALARRDPTAHSQAHRELAGLDLRGEPAVHRALPLQGPRHDGGTPARLHRALGRRLGRLAAVDGGACDRDPGPGRHGCSRPSRWRPTDDTLCVNPRRRRRAVRASSRRRAAPCRAGS